MQRVNFDVKGSELTEQVAGGGTQAKRLTIPKFENKHQRSQR